MENTAEQVDNRIEALKPYQFKKGQSGNPSGRPKGSVSLKTWAKNMLQTMTDEERLDFLNGLDKKTVWEMAEGKPEAKTDVTSGGKPLIIPSELINKNDTPRSTETNSEGQS